MRVTRSAEPEHPGLDEADRRDLAESRAESKRLAALLQDRDDLLELVLAASRTGIWEWDVVTGTLTWSNQISLQHGFAPGEVPKDYDAYLATLHPDDRDAVRASVQNALRSHEPYAHEFRIVWPDGSVHWTYGAGRALYDEAGNPIRMIGTGQDITERRRLATERDQLVDAERQANEWREAFIAVLSHELRTPITTILGASAVLTRPGDPLRNERREELLHDIAAEAARLERIVSDLVVLSQSERGTLELTGEPVGLQRIVARVVGDEERRWPQVQFRVEADPPQAIVLAEETYVEQVLRNMLGNAAKYGGTGTLVRVVCESDDDEATVRILDDGPGFPPDEAERLFESFYRSAKSARLVSGSGIGLFVCARLIEAMDGRIWARGRPEGGAEFGFALRLVEEVLEA